MGRNLRQIVRGRNRGQSGRDRWTCVDCAAGMNGCGWCIHCAFIRCRVPVLSILSDGQLAVENEAEVVERSDVMEWLIEDDRAWINFSGKNK